MVGQHDDRPWGALECARTLSCLGHLDLKIDPRDRASDSVVDRASDHRGNRVTVRSWPASAPTGSIAALTDHAADRGLQVTRTPAPSSPDRISFTPLGGADALELAGAIRTESNLAIGVCVDPSKHLLGWLPSLEKLRITLPFDDFVTHEGLERFDVTTGRWEPAGTSRAEGAYRTARLPRRHWHRSSGETRRSLDPLSKWLAAADVQPLLAYDPETQQLACHVGCRSTCPPRARRCPRYRVGTVSRRLTHDLRRHR